MMSLFSYISKMFSSSNKPEIVKSKYITSSVLKKLLKEYTGSVFAYIKTSDKDYSFVDKTWLLYSYYNYYLKVLKGLKIKGWQENFDCDNFSQLHTVIARALHPKGNTNTQSLAVGEFCYRQDSGGYHSIVCAIVDDCEIIFIEPQTGVEKCLSKRELESFYFAHF